jgi:hypothetical protein
MISSLFFSCSWGGGLGSEGEGLRKLLTLYVGCDNPKEMMEEEWMNGWMEL